MEQSETSVRRGMMSKGWSSPPLPQVHYRVLHPWNLPPRKNTALTSWNTSERQTFQSCDNSGIVIVPPGEGTPRIQGWTHRTQWHVLLPTSTEQGFSFPAASSCPLGPQKKTARHKHTLFDVFMDCHACFPELGFLIHSVCCLHAAKRQAMSNFAIGIFSWCVMLDTHVVRYLCMITSQRGQMRLQGGQRLFTSREAKPRLDGRTNTDHLHMHSYADWVQGEVPVKGNCFFKRNNLLSK